MNTKKTNRQPNLQVANMERLNRGDLTEKVAKERLLSEPTDQGDTKNFKEDKPKKIDSKNKKELPLPSRDQSDGKTDVPFKLDITEVKTDAPMDAASTDLDEFGSGAIDYRKRIKDRYTLRLKKEAKTDDVNISLLCDMKNDLEKHAQKEPVKTKTLRALNESKQPQKTQPINKAVSVMKFKPPPKIMDRKDMMHKKESLKNEKIDNAKETGIRKPIIKTITKNNTVFKDVKMFVDKTQPKPLKIEIPIKNDDLDRSSSIIPKVYSPPAQIIESPLPKRKIYSVRKKRIVKKDIQKRPSQVIVSQTDMVKLVPESTNQYTKPYYEAWVNKTLTATSKLKEKYRAIKELDEVPGMSEFGEQYAGKIRVRQRISKQRNL